MALIAHPRRLGFVLFNLAALALFALSWNVRAEGAREGVAGLPNLALGTTGMIVVAAVWAASWIAWAWMVWLRRRRVMGHRHGAA
jgi:hypothetical protein